MVIKKSRSIVEFGDFQTPDVLAQQVLQVVQRMGVKPETVIEPSCGRGAFLVAAANIYPDAHLVGLDVNEQHLAVAHDLLGSRAKTVLKLGSFFDQDWSQLISTLPAPLLLLGNPPWVTNAELGSIGSNNLPVKSNFQKLKGLDAITGKSNFDISEWMLLQNLKWLQGRVGVIAVLCKSAVARKVLTSAWKNEILISDARMYSIDALSHFNAAVEACLLYIKVDGRNSVHECAVYRSLTDENPLHKFGYIDGILVSNKSEYERLRVFRSTRSAYVWRSGIKHDCAKVMELTSGPNGLVNGLGEAVLIESTYIYPLIKSSDIAGRRNRDRALKVIVTQKSVGENTKPIATYAPKTWSYLESHRRALDGRTSVIYRNKPPFSIFGVGDYSFAPWKIAISGLYKSINFALFGSQDGKSTQFDDTVYFLPFHSYAEAQGVLALLSSKEAHDFLASMVFWDDKRPITVDLLKRLDILKLAEIKGLSHTIIHKNSSYNQLTTNPQLRLTF